MVLYDKNPNATSSNVCEFAARLGFEFLVLILLFHLSGHGKFETLGALGISAMLLATAGGIAWHAMDVLLVLFLCSN